jgi:hypothetical protein
MSHRGLLPGRAHGYMAIAVSIAFLAITATARAATIFSDGFESDWSRWTQVSTGGDGTAAIQSTHAGSGALVAQLAATSSAGSKAYARKTFSTVQQDLTMSADFKLLTQGASRQNVPFFRVFDPSSTRLVSLYRQNGTRGSIELDYGGARFRTRGKLALNARANISLHMIFDGSSSTVVVRLNGAQIYTTSAANLGTTGASTLQIGNDTAAQPFRIVVDTIRVQRAAPSEASPPINTAPASISGTPQIGQTLTAGPGAWTGAQPVVYDYEWQRCNNLGTGCTAIAGAGDATYAVTSADVAGTLRVAVTATNPAGAATATSGTTTIVAGASTTPADTSPPTISGTARQGQTLTASLGAWVGTQPIIYAYEWQRCNTTGADCVAVAGTSGGTYTLTAADVGSTVRVSVSVTNSAGIDTATSSATAVVRAGFALPGLVALWSMDETSGSVMLDSARSHHGILLNAVRPGHPGFAGFAYGFAGRAYVSVPSAPDLNPGGANITASIRLKTTVAPATPGWDLIRKGYYASPGGEYKMGEQPSGQVSCGFKGSRGYAELTAGPRVNDNVWHTVQCVKTPTSIAVVIDGQRFSMRGAVGSISNRDVVPIGARPGSEYFHGLLDEASIQIG